jgi:hypothetical protein
MITVEITLKREDGAVLLRHVGNALQPYVSKLLIQIAFTAPTTKFGTVNVSKKFVMNTDFEW